MSIRCPKCHAGIAALTWFYDYLQNGSRIQVVKCVCGFQRSRPAPAPAARFVAPRKPNQSQPQIKLPATHRSGHPHPRHQCTRIGCTGTYGRNSKYDLCQNCAKPLYRWMDRGMHSPPPYLYQDGVWIDNQEWSKNKKRRIA
ncbi:MAG: hypothetical protein L3J57_14800 [Desulfuromusa sp.]|nr:hypothetical protein [Desulfuromusa sp.]